ncbi:MAG TPA: alkaline phosphatase family protein, partial [Novosphingobium sp.]|nr:alkaline phosphatase family protein [Novosphingobium sp.]
DPANGIARTITEADIAKGGGNPQAAFYLNLADGVMALPYINPLIPTMVPAPYKGMHGYFPDDPRMRSTFLLMGPGVPAGRNLGEVDMRAIAPTLARIMGGRLAGAEVAPLGF